MSPNTQTVLKWLLLVGAVVGSGPNDQDSACFEEKISVETLKACSSSEIYVRRTLCTFQFKADWLSVNNLATFHAMVSNRKEAEKLLYRFGCIDKRDLEDDLVISNIEDMQPSVRISGNHHIVDCEKTNGDVVSYSAWTGGEVMKKLLVDTQAQARRKNVVGKFMDTLSHGSIQTSDSDNSGETLVSTGGISFYPKYAKRLCAWLEKEVLRASENLREKLKEFQKQQ